MVQAAGMMAVTGGRLIDDTGTRALMQATVIIEGAKITAVKTDLTIPSCHRSMPVHVSPAMLDPREENP